LALPTNVRRKWRSKLDMFFPNMPFLFLANSIISTLVKPVQLFYFRFANLLLTGFKDTYHVDSDLKLLLNITKSWGSLFFTFFSFYYLTKICFIWLTIFDHIKFGKNSPKWNLPPQKVFDSCNFFSFSVEIFFFLFLVNNFFKTTPLVHGMSIFNTLKDF